jgi:hypothetical protein
MGWAWGMNTRFHKRRRIYGLATRLLASQEGLSSIEKIVSMISYADIATLFIYEIHQLNNCRNPSDEFRRRVPSSGT